MTLQNSGRVHLRPTRLDTLEFGDTRATRGKFRLLNDHVGNIVLDREADVALGADQGITLMPEGDLAHGTDQ